MNRKNETLRDSGFGLLAMDLDGTLLDPHKRVPGEAVRLIAAALESGRQVVFATGRGKAEMDTIRAQLPFVRYGILESGAVVYDFAAGKALERFPLPKEKVEECLDACLKEDAMPQFLTEEESVVSRHQLFRMAEYGHGGSQGMFERVCTRVEDMRAWARAHPDGIYKICMYHRSTFSRDRTRERLTPFGMELKDSEETSLEATEKNVTKGAALTRLCGLLGFSLDSCAACGDGENDLELLHTAGFAIAMGNASALVRSQADAVVSGNDAGGQAQALRLVFPELTGR